MSEICEYRGVVYSIPRNDTGIWHYKIHPGHLAANHPRPETAPVEGYASRDGAVKAAEAAIDAWLRWP